MRILIIGAGVIGSLYARLLVESGCDITVYARGARLEQLAGGVRHRTPEGAVATNPVQVCERIDPEAAYDLALVAVRFDQAEAALAEVATADVPVIMTMINNPYGYRRWAELVGKDRLMPAFPGAGGSIDDDGVMDARLVPGWIQPTTLGELDGTRKMRLRGLVAMFTRAGIPVAVCDRMRDWQLSHLALVCPLAEAVYLAHGDHLSVAQNREALSLVARLLRRNFSVLAAKGVRITPRRLSMLTWLPESIVVALLGRVFRSQFAEWAICRHARAGRAEVELLRDAFYAELGIDER